MSFLMNAPKCFDSQWKIQLEVTLYDLITQDIIYRILQILVPITLPSQTVDIALIIHLFLVYFFCSGQAGYLSSFNIHYALLYHIICLSILTVLSVIRPISFCIVNMSSSACVGCSPTPSPALMTGLREYLAAICTSTNNHVEYIHRVK